MIEQAKADTKEKKTFREIFREFRNHSPVRKMRMIVMYALTMLSYFATVYLLFLKEDMLASMVPLFLFFAFFHFAFLEVRHRGFWFIVTVFSSLAVIEILVAGFGTRQIPITILIFNAAIVMLAVWLNGESTEKRKFSSRGYFAVGGYVFTIFMTVAYSLFLIGGKGNFDLTCDNLENTSHSFIDTVMTPLTFGKKQVKLLGNNAEKAKENVQDFFATDIRDLIGLSEKVDVEEIPDETFGSKISEKFNELKEKVTTAVDSNTQINLGICDLILKRIEKTYEHPAFQFAIVLLMFILLYPFVRIAFWIVSAIAFVVFKILYRLGVYKKHKMMEEVEEIV